MDEFRDGVVPGPAGGAAVMSPTEAPTAAALPVAPTAVPATAPTTAPTTAPAHRTRSIVLVTGVGVLGLAATPIVPTFVLVVCLALAVVCGMLTAAWGWLANSRPAASALGYGLRGAVVGGSAGLLLAGFAVLFGPATVAVLPAVYGIAAMLGWMLRQPRGSAC